MKDKFKTQTKNTTLLQLVTSTTLGLTAAYSHILKHTKTCKANMPITSKFSLANNRAFTMKYIILIFVCLCSANISKSQNIKPQIISIDTLLFKDINGNGIRDSSEIFKFNIELTNVGFDKLKDYNENRYFLTFKLQNLGSNPIQHTMISTQWIHPNENSILYSTSDFFSDIVEVPLEKGFNTSITLTYKPENYITSEAVRVTSFLEIEGTRYKLFSLFKMNKNEYYIPIDKKYDFKIVNVGYSNVMSVELREMLVGKVDYQISNISDKIANCFDLKFVWKNLESGLVVSTTTENINYSHDNLLVGNTISKSINTNFGYYTSTFPYRLGVDVYYVYEGEEIPIQKDIEIK